MNDFISENKLNLTYAITSAEDVKQICKPLLSKDIKHFTYLRLFKDGTHQLLCTHPDWVRSCYLYHYTHTAFHQDPRHYQTGYELWTNLKDQTMITIAKEQFNIAHGIALIKRIGDDCELFHFATSRDKPDIVNFYINNLYFLENFVLYFREHARHLIKKSMADRKILPQWGVSNAERINFNASFISENLIQNPSPIKRYYINSHNDEYVTPTELKCVNLLANGLSIKRIAKTLTVSPRTVESHFNVLRKRLNCDSRSQLLAVIIKNLPFFDDLTNSQKK